MSELKVHYSSLTDAASSIQLAANQLKSDLDGLLAKVKGVAASWEGEAHQAFDATARAWQDQADHIHSTLIQISSKVESASHNYSATDKKTAGYFQ
ncbi:WXG100 family type VII secretion target [Streptomyces sp. SID13666]|uniref:WXG100 family type VII secretion target n=1 Tax=unclassified Streptomyces TaxID=2593676 RepID=UPI0011073AB2|nr:MULTISPECIES: WXG100 family type VII secretion target [unclassified Streptomyces]MCM2425794.1 WXG100 family type VII secretion target [Streptomyces sp. RKAG337]MCZ4100250.1 WXG100 family type VII secretion target [Streptomyces sp. H39-C1]NEA60554.1 WXG100 family type VII secretion target [Streptomyces sp. SID13666]NEA76600.1 WXG100 family type VII secretion target [Streptomyces sp. SID13588]QNA75689.1 WXG100 family type VII secretion target [Streptomyces sp. So13.3]